VRISDIRDRFNALAFMGTVRKLFFVNAEVLIGDAKALIRKP